MKMTFRWYGESDPVKLEYIRQIPGMTGIVSAIYDVPVGEVWPLPALQALRDRIEGAGLAFEVVESVPVHEDIKLGKSTRDRLIANYQQNIRNCSAVGVKVICYNFMPVFDWTRTENGAPIAGWLLRAGLRRRRSGEDRPGEGHCAAGLGCELQARATQEPAQ